MPPSTASPATIAGTAVITAPISERKTMRLTMKPTMTPARLRRSWSRIRISMIPARMAGKPVTVALRSESPRTVAVVFSIAALSVRTVASGAFRSVGVTT